MIEYLYLTKVMRKPLIWIAVLLVLIIGVAIISMLLLEHQRALKLVENNQILMKNTVLNTLRIQLNNKQLGYPQSVDELDRNWKSLSSNFFAFSNSQRVYPNIFAGVESEQVSPLWQTYETLDSALMLTPESQLRIKAILDIQKELTKNETRSIDLNSTINHYLSLVENNQLSPVEEIISALKFLQIRKDSRWNDQLIDLFIFTGSNEVTPISSYLFKQNEYFSRKDINLIISQLRELLELTQLDLTWFNKKINGLWIEDITTSPKLIKDNSIVKEKWFVIEHDNNFKTLVPFDYKTEILEVEITLKIQNILDASDQIIFSENSLKKVSVSLNDLQVNILRNRWIKQFDDLKYFLIIKLLLAVSFILAFLTILFFVNNNVSRKLKYLSMKDDFLNLVSHELKTPLASIRIMTETISKRSERNLSIKDYPNKIVDEVDQLWLMVDNLLSLNQIRSGELQLNIDKIELSSMIERINTKIEVTTTKNISLTLSLPDHYYIFVDPNFFELVLVNLLSNAIKYSKHKEIDVEFSIDNNNDILIKDNGCGIQEKLWPQVFDDFYRVPTTSNQQGTGIGLSLCRQIMNIHKGNIDIIDSSESGTVWRLSLPKIER